MSVHDDKNLLMLGICGHLIHHPERFRAAPCLKMVEDENDLILAVVMTPPHKLIVYVITMSTYFLKVEEI